MEYIRDNPQINPLELVCMDWQLCVLLLLIYLDSLQLTDVANGLNFLHSKHLVHGDLRAVCPIRLHDDVGYSCMARRNVSL